ncbi:Cna B-type domain-containing protein, partial [Enterococcus casseliflavus]|uniref:Cna B-type domain-containing protein n=2 Tax=Enterococcus casseliflavus TaxID=37734 RepID=UPI0022E5E51C
MSMLRSKWYPLTMLIVLLIQVISSPLTAFAEMSDSGSVKVTLNKLTVLDNEENDQEAVVTIEATLQNATETAQTAELVLSQEGTLVADAQPEGITISQSDPRTLQVVYDSQNNTSIKVQVKVAKSDQVEQLTVTESQQTLETTIPAFTVTPADQASGAEHETTDQVVEEAEDEDDVASDTNQTNPEKDATPSSEAQEATDSLTKSTEDNTPSTVDGQETKKAGTQESAAREPINIASLFEEGDQFITDLAVNVYDKTGKEYDYQTETIPADALIKLSYDWSIPEHLLDPLLLQSGDYYELALPKELVFTPGKGDLKNANGDVYGEYEFTADGKIRWTFNSKIEEEHDIKGTTVYLETLTDDTELGSTTIKVPLGDREEEVTLNTRPQTGQSISKKGELSGTKSIDWTVSINTELATLTNAYVEEAMPSDKENQLTEVIDVKVFKQTVSKDGSLTVGTTPLMADKDYTWDKATNLITFIGDYQTTNESFVIKYHTDILDDTIPFDGGKVEYKNTATLVNGETKTPASSTVEKAYGKLIEKSNPKLENNGSGPVYAWQIKYNYGLKELPANTQIVDTLQNANLSYDQESFVVKAGTTVLEEGKDYTLTFSGQSATINFPKGLNQAVTIDYKTAYNRVIDDDLPTGEKIENKVTTEVNGKTSGDSGELTIAKNGIIKSNTIDYQNRTIKWTITVNRFNYWMKNWSLVDTIPEGLTYKPGSFSIKTGNQSLIENEAYQVTWSANQFEATFLDDRKNGTKDTYTITYETTFDLRKGSYINKATSTWADNDGTSHKQSTENTAKISANYVSDASKSGTYNATTKTIAWSTIVNYNQDHLVDATIVDPITGNQEYVVGSAKLYERIVNADGTTKRGALTSVSVSYNSATKTLSVGLPDDQKTYELYFETSLDGQYIVEEYNNNATFKNDEYTYTAKASVDPKNGGDLATKTGKVDPNNSNYVLWEVTVNPSLSTVKDMIVVDKPSTNQSLDAQSVKVYKTGVAADGTISKAADVLTEDEDYQLTVTTDNDTGQQEATVKFLHEIDTAYIIVYRALVTSGKITDELTNAISVKGYNEETITDETNSSVKVTTTNGTAEGSSASMTLVKTDETTGALLPGAKLEIWTMNSDGTKQQMIRSGVTDEKGELRFGNLRAATNYLLIETEAPTGHTVSAELVKGQVINIAKDDEMNTFARKVVTNARTKVTFIKQDAESKNSLAGAQFLVQNEAGGYYNGTDTSGVALWVINDWQVSASVRSALTSNEAGALTIEGLTPGQYQLQEIKAPAGYTVAEKKTPFIVAKESNGVVQLANESNIVTNDRIKTSVSGIKTWKDFYGTATNIDSRPDSIIVNLLQDGKTIQSKEVKPTSDGIWKYAFTNLDKYDVDGNAYVYTITENPVENYTTTINGYDILNTFDARIDVSGTKTWSDFENKLGKRPAEIYVTLYANDEYVTMKKVIGSSNQWTYTFNNQPKYDQNGKEITYTVRESAVERYEATYDGVNILNTYNETTEISGSKVWDDYNNKFNTRAEAITINLLQNGKEINEVTLENTAKQDWKYSFKDLPVYDAKGEAYVYTVSEDKVPGYSTEVKGTTIKNTYRNTETTEISGSKVWDD